MRDSELVTTREQRRRLLDHSIIEAEQKRADLDRLIAALRAERDELAPVGSAEAAARKLAKQFGLPGA